ncbi:MAG: flavin reductase family protein [Candidatus Caldarchaeum sp.]
MTSLREFMRRVPQCVTVVATCHEGKPHGMTVSSFASVSLNPPLVVVSLERNTMTCSKVQMSKKFAVNLLGQDQSMLSDIFAYVDHDERFKRVKFRIEKEVFPVLDDVVGVLFCTVDKAYEAGDHLLVVGRVEECKIYSDNLPLVYHQRQYFTVGPIRE